ncbi:MAG: 4'-phosphopantetheinyl transferase superfamily protein [Actinomycetota bacterium]|nr:4'-phosphopantetheinyl transferase superfamily protein [Actinomycetota bacterium]
MADVSVWYLSATTWPADRYLPFVSDDERFTADRFRFPSDAGRFLASRALVRAALARQIEASPAELVFDRCCAHCGSPEHGRPSLVSRGGALQPWHFSVTRAGSLVAVAVGSSPIGLDAEPLRATIDGLVESSVFSEDDRTWMRAGPTGSRSCRLLTRWVAKEAIGKAAGRGLIEADRIVTPPPGEGWNRGADASGKTLWLTWLTLPDVVAAVATYDRQHHLRVRDARDLGLLRR